MLSDSIERWSTANRYQYVQFLGNCKKPFGFVLYLLLAQYGSLPTSCFGLINFLTDGRTIHLAHNSISLNSIIQMKVAVFAFKILRDRF